MSAPLAWWERAERTSRRAQRLRHLLSAPRQHQRRTSSSSLQRERPPAKRLPAPRRATTDQRHAEERRPRRIGVEPATRGRMRAPSPRPSEDDERRAEYGRKRRLGLRTGPARFFVEAAAARALNAPRRAGRSGLTTLNRSRSAAMHAVRHRARSCRRPPGMPCPSPRNTKREARRRRRGDGVTHRPVISFLEDQARAYRRRDRDRLAAAGAATCRGRRRLRSTISLAGREFAVALFVGSPHGTPPRRIDAPQRSRRSGRSRSATPTPGSAQLHRADQPPSSGHYHEQPYR